MDLDFGSKLQDALINGVKTNGLDEEHLKFDSAIIPLEVNDTEVVNNDIESLSISQDNLSVEIAAAS